MTIQKKTRERAGYWAFVLPALIFVVLVSIVPLIFNFYYALFKWNGISASKTFVGLDNFRQMFKDAKFIRSVKFTSRYMILSVLITNAMSLGISAILAGASKALSNFGRAAYYIPCITASTATGLMWRFIFRDGMDTLYSLTGWQIFGVSWIGSPIMSFYSILLVGIWGSVGFYNIIYIAALLSVPAGTLEAALIDGASKWKRFWHVTFPQILPTFSVCLLLSLINGFKVFDPILMITEGGPAGMTASMTYSIYTTAFSKNAYGMASAKALVFFLGLAVLTIIELGVTRKVSES